MQRSNQNQSIDIVIKFEADRDLDSSQMFILQRDLIENLDQVAFSIRPVSADMQQPEGVKAFPMLDPATVLLILSGIAGIAGKKALEQLSERLTDALLDFLKSKQLVRLQMRIGGRVFSLDKTMTKDQAARAITAALDQPVLSAPSGTDERRFALIIGTTDYHDQRLARLKSPGADAKDLAALLENPQIGNFTMVLLLLNEPVQKIRQEIERFFHSRLSSDLLMLYFSGHGVRDESGKLYLAGLDTDSDLLRSTAVSASFIRSEMERSMSKRQVVVLDCCFSGAFLQGTKSGGAVGSRVNSAAEFIAGSAGSVFIGASDTYQYAWDGEHLDGKAQNSVFTHFFIEGLQSGEADSDGDGWISVDELYHYVYDRVVQNIPDQEPVLTSLHQKGRLRIARNPHPQTPYLPSEVLRLAVSHLSADREAAVHTLSAILDNGTPSMQTAAQQMLIQLQDDDSRRVSQAALFVLRNRNLTTNKPEKNNQEIYTQPSQFTVSPLADSSETGQSSVVPVIDNGTENTFKPDLSEIKQDLLVSQESHPKNLMAGNPPQVGSNPVKSISDQAVSSTEIPAGKVLPVADLPRKQSRPYLGVFLGGIGMVFGMVCLLLAFGGYLFGNRLFPPVVTLTITPTHTVPPTATHTDLPTATPLPTNTPLPTFTPRPTATPKPVISIPTPAPRDSMFRESFDSNVIQFDLTTTDITSRSVTENGLYLIQLNQSGYFAWEFLPVDFEPNILRFYATLTLDNQSSMGTIGAICNFQDKDNFVYAEIRPQTKEFWLRYEKNSEIFSFESGVDTGKSEIINSDDWNLILISCQDHGIRLFVNNEFIAETSDLNMPTDGLMGLFILLDEDDPAERLFGYFDEVVAWKSNP